MVDNGLPLSFAIEHIPELGIEVLAVLNGLSVVKVPEAVFVSEVLYPEVLAHVFTCGR